MSVKTPYKPSKRTEEYNRRVGKRLKTFRELRGMNQKDLYPQLGYKSTGAGSLIEGGEKRIE